MLDEEAQKALCTGLGERLIPVSALRRLDAPGASIVALALRNSLIGALHPFTCVGETVMRIARSTRISIVKEDSW